MSEFIPDRVTHGRLDPNQPFPYRPYDQPLTSIDPEAVFRAPGLNFWKRVEENPHEVADAWVGPGSLGPVSDGQRQVYSKPELSGLSPNRAISELFEWHMNHLELLNLTRQADDHSLFDMHLTALFRRGEELYRSHFVKLPALEIGTADIDYLNAGARSFSNGALVTMNHGIAMLPFWLAALHRLPRPWNDMDPSQSKELAGFAAVTEFVLRGTRAPGLNKFVAELSETNELQRFATGYGGWYANPDGSGQVRRQDETESPGAAPLAYVRLTIETFILCHELAHVALGHLDRLVVSGPRHRWSERERLNRHAALQQAEIEADALAIEMTSNLRPHSVSGSLPYRIFAPIYLVEALVTFYLLLACGEPRFDSFREINERTHPLAITRLKCAIYHFAKWFWRKQEREQQNLIGAIESWRGDLLVLPHLVRAASSYVGQTAQ